MIFQKFKTIRILTCVCLALTCLLMSGCFRVEAHREFFSDLDLKLPDFTPSTDNNRPRVALTFDAGPSSITTKPIVDELNKYGYHATFFVVGNRVDRTAGQDNGADAMVYAYENGNEIGIHGYTHEADYADCSDDIYRYEYWKSNRQRDA